MRYINRSPCCGRQMSIIFQKDSSTVTFTEEAAGILARNLHVQWRPLWELQYHAPRERARLFMCRPNPHGYYLEVVEDSSHVHALIRHMNRFKGVLEFSISTPIEGQFQITATFESAHMYHAIFRFSVYTELHHLLGAINKRPF